MSKNKNQEKRLTDDMSGKVTFRSQCSGCISNNPPRCEYFSPKPKPEKYRWNEVSCPHRK